jgi:hypothetical protein
MTLYKAFINIKVGAIDTKAVLSRRGEIKNVSLHNLGCKYYATRHPTAQSTFYY